MARNRWLACLGPGCVEVPDRDDPGPVPPAGCPARVLQPERVPFARRVGATAIPPEGGRVAGRQLEAGAAIRHVLGPHGVIAPGRSATAAASAGGVAA